jgi:hypothetical protein
MTVKSQGIAGNGNAAHIRKGDDWLDLTNCSLASPDGDAFYFVKQVSLSI